jgi:hypothetical protein
MNGFDPGEVIVEFEQTEYRWTFLVEHVMSGEMGEGVNASRCMARDRAFADLRAKLAREEARQRARAA